MASAKKKIIEFIKEETKDIVENMDNSRKNNDVNKPQIDELTNEMLDLDHFDKNSIKDFKDFKMPTKAEEILDLYITKLEDFYNQLEDDKKDVISQKAKVLEAILNTDILKTE